MITLHDVEQGTPEWFKLREGKVTGSNAHILLSKGKREAVNGRESFTGNFYTARGHILEKEAIELYEKIHDTSVLATGFVTNDQYKNAGFSPDGLLSNKLIEVKCFQEKRHTVKPDITVLAQVHFGMMICELPQADIVMYNPDLSFDRALVIHTVKRDERIIKNIRERLNG